MTVLEDHQFELLQTEDYADGVVFGWGSDVNTRENGFDPGTRNWKTNDVDDPQSGTTRMGRDVRLADTWAWSLFANQTSESTALNVLETLGQAWSGPGVNGVAGEYAVIRYMVAGRVRRVYGRPRRWAAPPTNLILSGMVDVTCDFKLADPLMYDDVESSVVLDLVAESTGGVTYPVVYPIISLPSGSNQGSVFVGGSRPTWPIIRIAGPITNPELETPGWKLTLNTTIAEGNWIEIDTRPWKRTVRDQSGASVAGTLSPRTRLTSMFVVPGAQSFTFRGSSATMTATATLRWRGAHDTL